MRKPILIIATLIYFVKLSAQDNVSFLATEVCNQLKKAELTGTKEENQLKVAQLTKKVYTDHYDKTRQIVESIKKEQPNASMMEIQKTLGYNMNVHLINNCNEYITFLRENGPSVSHPNNKSLKMIGDEMCDILEKNKALSLNELDDLITDHLYEITEKHDSLVKADYKDGLDNPDLPDHVNAYLMNTCNSYFKIAALMLNGKPRSKK